jgi:hypothetical protein
MLGAQPGEGCLSAVVRATEGYSGSDLTEVCAQVRWCCISGQRLVARLLSGPPSCTRRQTNLSCPRPP